jgi:MerR family mercuric resistance operon transcriptional regulator
MDNVPWYGLKLSSCVVEGAKRMQEGTTIGRLAKAVGVHVETIRYYQRIGLIDEPQKPPGGHRRYPESMVKRIGFIRRAQQLGFSLEEVKRLLDLSHGRNSRETRLIAERKYALLETRVDQLNDMRRELKRLIDASKKSDGRGPCPIIAALSDSH